jgi:hypothetical protein
VLGLTPLAAAKGQIESWLTERANMNHLIKEHLNCVVNRMKHEVDKHRSERDLYVGSFVYLKLQPYVQSSVLPRANHKLCFKYFGPYQVLSKVGSMAYHLKLPATSSIHPVVHVSQLKPAVGFKGGGVSYGAQRKLSSGPGEGHMVGLVTRPGDVERSRSIEAAVSASACLGSSSCSG